MSDRPMNLAGRLLEACERWSERTALEEPQGELTYGQLQAASAKVADELRGLGLVAHEPVIVLVSNRAMDWAQVLGLWRAGGVLVPLHRTTPVDVFEEFLKRTQARFVLDATGEFTVLGTARVAGGPTILEVAPKAPKPRKLLVGAALIVFTSGTTGRPKGTVLGHEAFAGKLDVLQGVMGFSTSTRGFLVLQMTFSFGLWFSLLALTHGGRLVLCEKFDQMGFLTTLNERRVTTVALVPTMLRALFATSDPGAVGVLGALLEGKVLRQLILGGEALDARLDARLRAAKHSVDIFDVYGTTETATSDFILRPEHYPALHGTLGHSTEGVAWRVVDESGVEVNAGQEGELEIRSRFAMNGYFDEPELTREGYRDGYFRSGDVVRRRDDGALELVGRSKELILRGGNKISPLEVEAALLAHPGVSEVLITGVPDPLMGERIHGLVVPMDGTPFAAQALREWVGSRIEKFKVPDTISFGAEIPRGRTGKVDRGELRRQVCDSGAADTPEAP